MTTPIIMTTYERPDYFSNTIISFMANTDDYDLHIFDDCSKNEQKKHYLSEIKSLANVMVREENRGTVLNTIPAIDYVYERSDSEYIVLVQDDVLFSKNWLNEGIKRLDYLNTKHFKIAFISLYNRGENKKAHIMPNGHPGGVCWIINRKFWTWYRSEYKNRDTDYMVGKCDAKSMRHIVDYKLSLRIRRNNWTIGCVGKSLVQHVGDRSTLSGKDMSYCRVNNFVGENA